MPLGSQKFLSNFLRPLVNCSDCRCRGQCPRNTWDYGGFDALRAPSFGPGIPRLTPEDPFEREISLRLSEGTRYLTARIAVENSQVNEVSIVPALLRTYIG